MSVFLSVGAALKCAVLKFLVRLVQVGGRLFTRLWPRIIILRVAWLVCPSKLNILFSRRICLSCVVSSHLRFRTRFSFLTVFQILHSVVTGALNVNFRENTCSEDDLRSRIFGTFVVKFLA